MLRCRIRTSRVKLRPVDNVATYTVARVIFTLPGHVHEANVDDNDIRIGKRLASFGVGLQLSEQIVDPQSIVLGEVLNLHWVAGCLCDGRGIPVDEAGAAETVVRAVVWDRIANRYERPGRRSGGRGIG